MKKIITIFGIGLPALLMLGCSKQGAEKIFVPKTEIVAVYMHHVNNYSVAVKNSNRIDIVRLPWQLRNTVEIIADVAQGSPMWYACDGTYSSAFGDTTGSCEIHIRDVDDINSASWNHGKAGTGTTQRIQ